MESVPLKLARPRLFNLLAVVSLLLCVATLVLRMDTRDRGATFRTDHFYTENNSGAYGISVWQGTIFIARFNEEDVTGELMLFDTAQQPFVPHWSFNCYRGECGMFLYDGYDVDSPGPLRGTPPAWAFLNRKGWRDFDNWEIQGDITGFMFPAWFVAILFGMIPAWQILSWLRERRRMLLGLCASCGYDLRATPGRCPECGLVVKEHKRDMGHESGEQPSL